MNSWAEGGVKGGGGGTRSVKMTQWPAEIDGMRKRKSKRQTKRKGLTPKNKKRMVSRSKSRKTIGPCSSSAQASTFRRFPMSPLEQREGEVCG